MDKSQFSKKSPGRTIRIEGPDWAFIPNPLPPEWEIPKELWPLIVDANRHLALLEGIGKYLPNPAIFLRPLEDREAIQSSRIEGTYATARELLLFEKSPREPTSEGDRANAWNEVHNYRRALLQGAASPLPLSLRLIRDLHRTLMTGVRGRDRAPGEFRRFQVAIGHNHRFIPPPATEVMECLSQLETYFHQKNRTLDSLIDCFLVHYQFETIHPFMDGNGRVGRLLLALMIQRFCNLSKPWLYMSPFFEQFQDDYVKLLFNVSSKGDWTSWFRFCLEGTVRQSKDTIHRCEQLLKIKGEFAERIKQIRGSNRLNRVVEEIFFSPFVGIAELADKCSVHYQTAQRDVKRLVDAGILQELPEYYPKTYYSPEIYRVAYADLGSIEPSAEERDERRP